MQMINIPIKYCHLKIDLKSLVKINCEPNANIGTIMAMGPFVIIPTAMPMQPQIKY